MYKKIIACVMAVTMLFGITAYANTNMAETTNVDTLSQLKIVKGNGKGYDEDGQIRRSEAAAIIVRLLGEEDNVLQNYDPSTQINYYTDVEPKMWYAPYINYIADKGIINGYSDYTFRPNEYISEKAVIKMILGVLGYKYIIDFNWNNIYEKAFEYGLVEDESYKTMTADNVKYTRGETFALVKNALETKQNDSDRTLIQTWMDNERFTKAEVAKAGLDADEIKTEISKIETPNSTSIRVTFNEVVKGITKDNVTIAQKDTDKKLTVSKVTINDKLVTIVTSAQSQLKDYEVFFQSVVDQDDFATTGLTIGFKGYMNDEIESNKFLISKIEAVSKDTIKVYFTQPIGDVSMLQSLYDIYEDDSLWVDGDSSNMYIAKLPDSNRGVIIRLTNRNYDIKKMYKLKISGTMVDKTGVKLNDGEGDNRLFPPLVIDNFELKRELTYAFSKDVVTVEFNKAVDGAVVGKLQVIGPSGGIKDSVAKLDPTNPKRVLLSMVAPLSTSSTYKLNIFSLKDLEQATSLSETNIEFGVDDQTVDKLEVALVEPVSNSEIRVYFNRALSEPSIGLSKFFISSASDSNFSGDNLFNQYHFNEDQNPTMVTLYLNPSSKKMKEGSSYTLKVSNGLKDYLGRSNGELTYNIDGVGYDKQSPNITSGWILGTKTIKLEFDKPIADVHDPNKTSGNYKVKYKNSSDEVKTLIPNGVSVYESKYVIITMDEDLDYSKVYKIEYTMIKDYREDSFAGGASKEYILNFAY